jgi:predicted SprT family Zn-dependent metalloprotease
MAGQTHIDPSIEPYWEYVERWADTWELPDIADQVRIEFSNRLRTSIGLCYPERSLIRLHPVVRELDEPVFLEILCHELAHVAVYRRFGRRCRPHGREWIGLMEAAGFVARARLPQGSVFATPAQRAARKTILWHHRCPRCHASRTARRPVYTWRCAACRKRRHSGKLRITREEVVG